MSGQDVLVMASSSSTHAEKLGVPSSLRGSADDTVVVHVEIDDYSAYAGTVDAAETIRW